MKANRIITSNRLKKGSIAFSFRLHQFSPFPRFPPFPQFAPHEMYTHRAREKTPPSRVYGYFAERYQVFRRDKKQKIHRRRMSSVEIRTLYQYEAGHQNRDCSGPLATVFLYMIQSSFVIHCAGGKRKGQNQNMPPSAETAGRPRSGVLPDLWLP
jgi:hypothetical protein